MFVQEETIAAREAGENLRMIRALMERSTRYSTFSGLSGVLAGLFAVAGCLLTRRINPASADYLKDFAAIWCSVIALTLGADALLTKRRAARVGKFVLSRLGKQMALGALPGLGAGVLLTFWIVHMGHLAHIFPVWMLSYGIAVCAVGQFSQKGVSTLGFAFLTAGAFTMALPLPMHLPMMALTFGGFHILYGLWMSRQDGW